MNTRHAKLTPTQSAAAQALNVKLLELSKERHAFGRLSRRIGFKPSDTKELWEAGLAHRGIAK